MNELQHKIDAMLTHQRIMAGIHKRVLAQFADECGREAPALQAAQGVQRAIRGLRRRLNEIFELAEDIGEPE